MISRQGGQANLVGDHATSSIQQIVFEGSDFADDFKNLTTLPSEIWGRGGNDTLVGGFSTDTIDGGSGRDKIFGGFGNDSLRGGEGEDRIRGGLGDDLLWAGEGDDHLEGGWGNDILRGEAGDDEMEGGPGNDRLYGGDGIDAPTNSLFTSFGNLALDSAIDSRAGFHIAGVPVPVVSTQSEFIIGHGNDFVFIAFIGTIN